MHLCNPIRAGLPLAVRPCLIYSLIYALPLRFGVTSGHAPSPKQRYFLRVVRIS